MSSDIILGVSSCLLGEKVRFNGGHKKDSYLTNVLNECFKFQPYCPEVAIGLGVPREPIRLVGDRESPRAVGVKHNELDVTDELQGYSETVSKSLPEGMSGFIVKSKSPSCGMTRVKLYHQNGNPNNTSVGIFTRTLMQQNPQLPVEEEGRLCDKKLRENFLERVYLYYEWQQLLKNLSAKSLIAFHSEHKMSIMCHSPSAVSELGEMISNLKENPLKDIADAYFSLLMKTYKIHVTEQKQTNVLQHCMEYLKTNLDAKDKSFLLQQIERFHKKEVSLSVPITLLDYFFEKYPNQYINKQTFVKPKKALLEQYSYL